MLCLTPCAQALVPRFRALRESLTSMSSDGVSGDLVLAAYEAAAEACLRAGDAGEFLKCQARLLLLASHLLCTHTLRQQRLVSELYPAAAASGRQSARWPEFAALAALYFACAGGTPGEVAAALRATPQHLLHTAPVRCALRALGCLARGDAFGFCSAAVHADATPLLRLLMARRLPAARRTALRTAAKAYRMLPLSALVSRLQWSSAAAVALLNEAAAAPGAPPQLVAAAKTWASSDASDQLIFAS